MKLNAFAKFAWFVLAVNIFVILWGAFVRATGSGAGCGSHWPLCNGDVVPLEPRLETIIEFIHRLTSGAALLLVVAMVVWAWRAFPPGHRVRFAAVASMIGMIAESLAGASLVLFRWVELDISTGRTIMMPVHLIITFYLLASLALTAWWASGGQAIRWHSPMRRALAFGLLATTVMSMAGALTALGDTVLPVMTLTEEAIRNLPATGQFLVALRIWHPIIAVGVGIYLLWLIRFIRAKRFASRASIRRLTLALGAVFVIQLAAGMLNIILQVPVWMQITHLFLADLVWILLVLMSAEVLAQ
jgi:heme A synthase